MIETPRWDLTLFKVHFGNLTLKAYTKGEHVLRFEAITHNTKQVVCGRVLTSSPRSPAGSRAWSSVSAPPWTASTPPSCPTSSSISFPAPTRIGATRVGGIDLNKPRLRAGLSAALALSAAPADFTVAEFTTTVQAITRHSPAGYTIRQGAYDLRKLRGKDLVHRLTPHSSPPGPPDTTSPHKENQP